MFANLYITLTIIIITLIIINAIQEQNQTQLYKSEIRRIFVAKGETQNTSKCGGP